MGGCRRIAPAIALLAAGVTLSACGSDGEGTIPRDRGEEMLAALDALEQRRAQGECALMAGAVTQFETAAAALPDTVDRDVKQAILDGGGNLRELAADPDQCTSGATLEEEPTTTTTTTEAPPTTTTTTEAPPEQPPGEGDEGGSGPPGGGGQGQGGDGSGGTGAEKGKRDAGKQRGGRGAGS